MTPRAPALHYDLAADDSQSQVVDIKRLLVSMLLIQAGSGGGKSWALRHLVEALYGVVPIIIFDPEGEFYTLREKYDFFLAAPRGGDVEASPKTAPVLARKFRELGQSAVLDIFELPPKDRVKFVRIYLETLMEMPRSLWTQCILVLDEAQMFAPEKGEGEAESIGAVTDVSSRGRKRGLCLVAATQRLARFSNNVAGNLHNKLIGLTTLDADMDRAAKTLGFNKENKQTLAHMGEGEFYALGPAISKTVIKIKTGMVKTRHPEPGEIDAAPPPPSKKILSLIAKELANIPKEAEEEARTLADYQKKVRDLEHQLRVASLNPLNDAQVQTRIAEHVGRERATIDNQIRAAVAEDRKRLKLTLHALQRAVSSVEARIQSVTDRHTGQMKMAVTQENELRETANLVDAVKVGIDEMSKDPDPVAATSARRVPPGMAMPTTRREMAPGWKKVQAPRAIAMDRDVSGGLLTGAQLKILTVLAQFEAVGITKVKRSQVAAFSEYSASTKSFRNALSSLRAAGNLDYDEGYVYLTDAGRLVAPSADAPLSLEALHEGWVSRLKNKQGEMLRLLIDAHDAPGGPAIPREDLAAAVGFATSTKSFRNGISQMRSLGIIDYTRDGVVATDVLFPEGLS